jgi:hypothetical protein
VTAALDPTQGCILILPLARGCLSRSAFEHESPERNETCGLGGTLRLRQPRPARTAIGGSAGMHPPRQAGVDAGTALLFLVGHHRPGPTRPGR